MCHNIRDGNEEPRKRKKKMKNLNEIKKLIDTYDKMIEELVDNNASDKVIGGLELKRQKLIKQCKSIEANNTSTIVEEEEVQATYQNNQDEEKSDTINKVFAEKSGIINKVKIINNLNEAIEIYEDVIKATKTTDITGEITKHLTLKKEHLQVKVRMYVNGDFDKLLLL